MDKNNLVQRRNAATPRGVAVKCDWFAVKAENATVWDEQGRQWIDFAAGIAVLNTGHRHPKIVQAVEQQLKAFTHTAYQVIPYESYVCLAEKINQLAPIDGPCKTIFLTTGAEAVENAVKVARAYTKRNGIITFGSAFHGRSFMTMAMTGKSRPYKHDFGVMPAAVFHARYPNEVEGISVEEALASVQRIFSYDIDAKDVAAIVIEPIQGEGGFYMAPTEFMRGLRAICDEHGILLVADEVQTGFARTGKLFAMEHYADVKADLMTMAKSLGGGLPISGLVGKAEIMDAPSPGGLGGTYAGNPLAVAAAHAVLEVIEQEKLCQRANRLGEQLMQMLQSIQAQVPQLKQARTVGSMAAAEFYCTKTDKPNAEFVKKVVATAEQSHLLLLTCGLHGNVIRFLYPLTIPDAQFTQALEILKQAILVNA